MKQLGKWLASIPRGFSRLLLPFLLVMLISLPSCSSLPLSGLLGGGPNVANIQAGKNNTQTVGTTTIDERKVVVRPRANPRKVSQDNVTGQVETARDVTINKGVPLEWFTISVLIGLLGWMLPTPGQIGRSLLRLVTRK